MLLSPGSRWLLCHFEASNGDTRVTCGQLHGTTSLPSSVARHSSPSPSCLSDTVVCSRLHVPSVRSTSTVSGGPWRSPSFLSASPSELRWRLASTLAHFIHSHSLSLLAAATNFGSSRYPRSAPLLNPSDTLANTVARERPIVFCVVYLIPSRIEARRGGGARW